MNAQQQGDAGVDMSFRIGQRVRHQDYKGKRVTGVVRGLSLDSEQGLMVSIALDAPIVIPESEGIRRIDIWNQHAPAHEFSPFDERDELIAELLASLQGVIAVADRESDEFIRARAAIAKAAGGE
jgi:hypothetical protein